MPLTSDYSKTFLKTLWIFFPCRACWTDITKKKKNENKNTISKVLEIKEISWKVGSISEWHVISDVTKSNVSFFLNKAAFIVHCSCFAVSSSGHISVSAPTTALWYCTEVILRFSVLRWYKRMMIKFSKPLSLTSTTLLYIAYFTVSVARTWVVIGCQRDRLLGRLLWMNLPRTR